MHTATYIHIATFDGVQFLQEEYQILPNGVKRARGVPLSEKMKAGEAWTDAVLRAVKEELGSVLPSQLEVSTSIPQTMHPAPVLTHCLFSACPPIMCYSQGHCA